MVNLTVTQAMTTPSRPGKTPRPVWNVTGPDIEAFTDALYRLGGKKYRGVFSFWEDPTDAIAALTDDDRLSFAERQEIAQERAGDRAERLSERAANHSAEAQRRSDFARSIVHALNGQPVLRGHHSQRAHERLLDRVDASLGKAVAEREIAANLERRAELNERKASGEHTPAFIGRRIKEAKAEQSRMQRYLDAGHEPERYTALVEKYREQVAYWEAELAASGGIAYGKHNVKTGDQVFVRGRWVEVTRANATTVSVIDHTITPAWPGKHPYSEIQEVRHAS